MVSIRRARAITIIVRLAENRLLTLIANVLAGSMLLHHKHVFHALFPFVVRKVSGWDAGLESNHLEPIT
jgi:hypothetical protein